MEESIRFQASGKQLYGILHLPEGNTWVTSNPPVNEAEAAPRITAMLLMVVGGPQNRVGSHRSYTLMARQLCRSGLPVMRFDYAGIGDSQGAFEGFATAGPSLEAALDYLYQRFPALEKVVLWSLCDGSAACAMYAHRDAKRVAALILCNPYVHSEQGRAKAILKHYYLRRLRSVGFWKKLFSFRLNPLDTLDSLYKLVKLSLGRKPPPAPAAPGPAAPEPPGAPAQAFREGDPPGLPDKVMDGLEAYRGPVHIFLSTDDNTANEFLELHREREAAQARHGKAGGAPLRALRFVEGADHTFTEAEWKRCVCEMTLEAWDAVIGSKEKRWKQER